MLPLDLTTVRRVLLLGAHPDDIEIGCGATILTLIAAQPDLELWWVVLSGEPERAAEAQASCRSFTAGATGVEYRGWSLPDRYFPDHAERLKTQLHELAGACDPQLVFTHRRDDEHQDHRLVGQLTWQAFRQQPIWEYEIPKYEGDLGQPNVFVPVGERQAQRKVELLCEHFRSQRSKPWFDADTFRGLLRLRGLEARSPSRFAEAFYCRKLVVTLQPPRAPGASR